MISLVYLFIAMYTPMNMTAGQEERDTDTTYFLTRSPTTFHAFLQFKMGLNNNGDESDTTFGKNTVYFIFLGNL